MNFFRQSLTIAAKDLRSEFRTKETLNATISFSIVILLLFSFAFEPTEEEARVLSGGLLWLVFAFAGVLILNRGFARDLPNDCLDALIASPISGPALFFGKTIANFTLLLAVEFICVPVFGIFYDVPWTLQFWPIVTVTVLASWGLCVVGTAFSAMTVNLRLRELMLPMLVYPLMMPSMLAAIKLTGVLVMGQPVSGDLFQWLKLLIGFDVIYTALALALVDIILVG
jgi:heme exporter protein B